MSLDVTHPDIIEFEQRAALVFAAVEAYTLHVMRCEAPAGQAGQSERERRTVWARKLAAAKARNS